MSQDTSLTLHEKLIDGIGFANAAMEKAASQIAAFEKQAADVDALIPQVVTALVENERIDPAQTKVAAETLKDPVKALKVLLKVAEHRNASELGSLGTPTGGSVKTAEANTNTFVGGRSGGRSAADLGMLARFGIEPQ